MKMVLAAVAAVMLAGPAFAQAGHDMSAMPGMSTAAPAGAQGAGVVKKIDAKAGTVTLQHGPIAALKRVSPPLKCAISCASTASAS